MSAIVPWRGGAALAARPNHAGGAPPPVYPPAVVYMLATYGVDLRPVWDLQFATYPPLPLLHNFVTDPLPPGSHVSGEYLVLTQDTTFDRWDLRNSYVLSPQGAINLIVTRSAMGNPGKDRIVDPQDVNGLSWTFTNNHIDVAGMLDTTTSPFLCPGNALNVTFMNNEFVNGPNDYTQFFSAGTFIFKRNWCRAWANNGVPGGHAEANFLDGRAPFVSPPGCIQFDENLYDARNWIPGGGLTGAQIIKPSVGVSLPGMTGDRNIYMGMGTPGMGLVYLTVTGTNGGADTESLNVSNNIVQTNPAIFVAMVDASSDPNVTLTGGQNIAFDPPFLPLLL